MQAAEKTLALEQARALPPAAPELHLPATLTLLDSRRAMPCHVMPKRPARHGSYLWPV